MERLDASWGRPTKQEIEAIQGTSLPQRFPAGDAPSWPDSRPEGRMITASQVLGATPVGGYSWRPPSPPHIHIPQAPVDEPLHLPACSAVGYDDEESRILRIITKTQNIDGGPKDWKYEWRRKAQAILPFLYLGPSAATRDLDFVRREGITMLLVIRNTATAAASLLSGEKVARELGIQAAAVDVAGNPELIAAFPGAIKIINEHLISVFRRNVAQSHITPGPEAATGKVFVFCESGNERSAAVVAAYLLHMHSMDLISALQYVQSQRFCVAFDDGLKNLLLNYSELLKAQRSVAEATRTPQVDSGNINTKVKRRKRDYDSDDDMAMDVDGIQDDLERFENRSSFVPFQDSGASQ